MLEETHLPPPPWDARVKKSKTGIFDMQFKLSNQSSLPIHARAIAAIDLHDICPLLVSLHPPCGAFMLRQDEFAWLLRTTPNLDKAIAFEDLGI